jgi:hypothetical protein
MHVEPRTSGIEDLHRDLLSVSARSPQGLKSSRVLKNRVSRMISSAS